MKEISVGDIVVYKGEENGASYLVRRKYKTLPSNPNNALELTDRNPADVSKPSCYHVYESSVSLHWSHKLDLL